ncbi:hypothetical protein DY052_07575 [Apilactobacillus timberlakei]|uniref:hypothetical protein n=1 Tax=Apilactobacillus timberlakei TaxID=2008380 RepID=UPI00112CA6A4|nr:hypothetical protein [Apilactobacillus timberlakei]TPR13713.1 hypothetical protein DY052_07575 [Apilactobacillus timberlakei]
MNNHEKVISILQNSIKELGQNIKENNKLKKYCLFLEKLQDATIMTDIYDDFPIKYSIYDQQSAIQLIQQKNGLNEDLGNVNSLAELADILSPIKSYKAKYFVLKDAAGKRNFYNVNEQYLCRIFQDILVFVQSDRVSGYVHNIEPIIIENSFIID